MPSYVNVIWRLHMVGTFSLHSVDVMVIVTHRKYVKWAKLLFFIDAILDFS